MSHFSPASSSSTSLDTLINAFYESNFRRNDYLKQLQPTPPFCLHSIHQAIEQGEGKPLLERLSEDLFYGKDTPKIAALACTILNYAIDMGFEPAEALLHRHRECGFGYSPLNEPVLHRQPPQLEIPSHWLEFVPRYYPFYNHLLFKQATKVVLKHDFKTTHLYSSTRRFDYISLNSSKNICSSLIPNLAQSKYLVSLWLDGIESDIHTSKLIRDLIKENSVLSTLKIGFLNILALEEYHILTAIFKGLTFNHSLTSLHIINQQEDHKVTLLAAPGKLATTIEKALKRNTTLTSLSVASIRGYTADLFQGISKGLLFNTTLQHLSLIDISHPLLTTSFRSMRLPAMTSIFDALATNQSITSLDIEVHTFNDSDQLTPVIEHALKTNKTLTKLSLRSIKNYSTVLFQAISKGLLCNKTLQELDFSYTNLSAIEDTSMFAQALEFHPSLTSINLQLTELKSIAPIFQALSTNRSITWLDLQYNHTSDDSGIALAAALKTNTSLTFLDITANEFTESTLRAIAQSLEYNNTLTTLSLGCQFLDPPVNDMYTEQNHTLEFQTEISDLIALNGSLTSFSFSDRSEEETMQRNRDNQTKMSTPLVALLLNEI